MKTLSDVLRSGEIRPQDDWTDISEAAADKIDDLENLVLCMWRFIENDGTNEDFFKLRERVRSL